VDLAAAVRQVPWGTQAVHLNHLSHQALVSAWAVVAQPDTQVMAEMVEAPHLLDLVVEVGVALEDS
jgi:hypothetical protein